MVKKNKWREIKSLICQSGEIEMPGFQQLAKPWQICNLWRFGFIQKKLFYDFLSLLLLTASSRIKGEAFY